jgi:hypothetical protein
LAFKIGSLLFCPPAFGAGGLIGLAGDTVTLHAAFMVLPSVFDGDVAAGPKAGLTIWSKDAGLSLSLSYYRFIMNDAGIIAARAGVSVRTGRSGKQGG